METETKYLETLYGKNALEEAAELIEELRANSNIPFDMKYMQVGISFIHLKASEILEGKEEKVSLKSLVSTSFGEAAIYMYQCK